MHRLWPAVLTFVLIAGVAGCSSSTQVGGFITAAPSSATAAPASPSTVPATAAPASPSIVPATTVGASNAGGPTISLTEWKVAIPPTMKSGKSDVTINNQGTTPHELLIFKSDLAPGAYPTDAAGNIVEEGAGVALVSDGDNIDPGGSQVRTIDLPPGKYLFVCNIAGHFKLGMFTAVTVTN